MDVDPRPGGSDVEEVKDNRGFKQKVQLPKIKTLRKRVSLAAAGQVLHSGERTSPRPIGSILVE